MLLGMLDVDASLRNELLDPGGERLFRVEGLVQRICVNEVELSDPVLASLMEVVDDHVRELRGRLGDVRADHFALQAVRKPLHLVAVAGAVADSGSKTASLDVTRNGFERSLVGPDIAELGLVPVDLGRSVG